MKTVLSTTVLLCALSWACALPMLAQKKMLRDATPAQTTEMPKPSVEPPQIYQLHVTSQVISRFATTLVTSRLANRNEESAEAVFVVQLPDAAFISNFTMEIDGEIIVGEVKEKAEAKEAYEAAKRQGQSAGHVAQAPRKTNTFHISVNVAAQEKVVFNLTYQEILQRVHGVYKHILNIQPGQIVPDLKVDVFISENKEITTILAPEFGEKIGQMTNQELLKLKPAAYVSVKQAITPEMSVVHVSYQPKEKVQKSMEKKLGKGLAGQLVVLYDVKRDQNAGELQVVNGYFVHFFAPEGLKIAKKDVIFVIDTSGSMSGRKINQTKEAMAVILRDLKQEDTFNILQFSDSVSFWSQESVTSNEQNVESAVKFVNQLTATGGTNINAALEDALQRLLRSGSESINKVVIFLTDGQATVGQTDTDTILTNVAATNEAQEVSIQSIGFGSGADFSLLKKLSMKNRGLARKVYEDSDAALQLQGFYTEICSLLLRDVKISYLNETVEPGSIVQDNNYNYYEGSEFVVVGKLKNPETASDNLNFRAKVEATSPDGNLDFTASSICMNQRKCFDRPADEISGWIFDSCLPVWHCPPPVEPIPNHPEYQPLPPETLGGFVERMWAYRSIKKMLEDAKYDDNANATELNDKALHLSLKYNFVTELTSMVVIQPGANETALSQGNRSPSGQSESGRAAYRPKGYHHQSSLRSGFGFPSARRPGGGGGRQPVSSVSHMKGAPGPSGHFDLDQSKHAPPGPPPHPQPQPMPTMRPIPTARPPRITTTLRQNLCPENETHLHQYAADCEVKCGQIYQANERCSPKSFCSCKKGYMRTAGGNCIEALDCPGVPANCPDTNAEVKVCGCESRSCDEALAGLQKKCALCQPPMCACKDGYALNDFGDCVLESDCADAFLF